jgi:hypothetical protein
VESGFTPGGTSSHLEDGGSFREGVVEPLPEPEDDEAGLARQLLERVSGCEAFIAGSGRGSTRRSITNPAAANSSVSWESGIRHAVISQPLLQTSVTVLTSKWEPPRRHQSAVG